VENVILFNSNPVFTTFGNQANLTFELKSFDHIPYDVAPVIFRDIYCMDNGGQGDSARSNSIDVLKVKVLFPPELPSFLDASSSLSFIELAFSGVHEDIIVVNGKLLSNQEGVFALNQESRRSGYVFIKFSVLRLATALSVWSFRKLDSVTKECLSIRQHSANFPLFLRRIP